MRDETRQVLDQQKRGSAANHTPSPDDELSRLLADQGLEAVFALGREGLRTYREASEEARSATRTQLYDFLNFARRTVVLTEVSRAQRQNEWFQLLLEIIQASNFTLGQMFRQRVSEYGSKVLFQEIRERRLKKHTWAEIDRRVTAIARALLRFFRDEPTLGPVAILSENSLQMACIDVACLITGVVNVPIPANATPQDIEFIICHSQAKLVFVSNRTQLDKVDEVRSKLCHVRHAVLIDSDGPPPDDVLTYEQFLQLGDPFPSRLVSAAIERVKLDDLATVMYTSGTTQQPKGIKFSHLNIISKRFARAIALPEIGEDDTFLCYLPLFHTFGRYFEMLGAIFWGATYVFMESPKIDTMVANMKLAKPTVFISIPKKWIQLYEKIAENVDIELASDPALRRAVARVTGGKLRWGLSAAGYLDPEIFRFFQMTGVELMSGFGMTEATGGITMTPPGEYRDNSVGKALPGIEVRLAEDGEMMIRGPYVMVGYLHAKSSGIVDGWFRTGDIFTRDKDGFYEIIDRKKEIYKNIRGETISPQKIENLFSDFESVKRVFLVGDHRAYNTVLLYPNYDYDQVNFAHMSREEMRDFFGSLIVSVNQFLASYERIVNFEIIDRDFSAARGELTQKGTFKRKVVEENFRELIDAMYRKQYTIFRLDGFEVRVPNWFLREHGLTIENLKLVGNALVIPALRKRLRLRLTQQPETVIQIGELCYTADQGFIDLGEIVQHPVFWLGNLELEEFVGSPLLRDAGSPPRKSRGVRVKLPTRAPCPNMKAVREFRRLRKAEKPDLRGLHLAAHLFVTCREKNLQHTHDFFERVLACKDERIGRLGRIVLKRAQFAPSVERRRIAFRLLLRYERSERFKEVLEGFAKTRTLFTQRLVQEISELDLSRRQLQVIFAALRHHLNSDSPPGESERALVFSLLELLTAYGARHPTAFKSIRAELVRWTFDRRDERIRKRAEAAFKKLLAGFRRWLGPNQQIAVSVETGTEYGWPDVLDFEDNLPGAERKRISDALRQHPIIREAIFLFTNGRMVRLEDISHKGVAIRFLGSLHGKSVYRVTVQTHHFGSFDFAINVNESLSREEVRDEINWLICAGASESTHPLVEDFGGYWPKYDLWTEEFIPGETVTRFLARLERQIGPADVERVRILWSYLVWSGLSAYIDFWNRTGRALEVADPTPANVIVPSHDYQVGFRIVSISERKRFESVQNMILSFRNYFVLPVEDTHTFLQGACSWHVIFSAFLEILGEKRGTALLEGTLRNLSRTNPIGEAAILLDKLSRFISTVKQSGYLPKRLYFSIRRFNRWLQLNPQATTPAQLQTLQELNTTYCLDELEKSFPGTRIQFYRDTVFANSDPRFREELNALIREAKERRKTPEEFAEAVAKLREAVPLNQEEHDFLTRMVHPRLGPKDTAQMISLTLEGTQKAALVVFIKDQDGHPLAIRNPASPKEIARLHRLFTRANLPVDFQPEHQYLVVLNERAHVIGGLFYRQIEAGHFHLEKIVVDERYRRKAVSDGLMKEFFSRIKSQGARIVTVGFLRPEYFSKFGFTIDHEFGNMVMRLEEEPKKAFVEDLEEQF